MKFDFVKPTLIFALIGIFIPGFTAIAVIGLQWLLTKAGMHCSAAFRTIFLTTSFLAVLFPFIFYRYITRHADINGKALKSRLAVFNLMEYIAVQFCLTPLFTSGEILCNVADGQNGIELIFTGWLALPILLVMSFVFSRAYEMKHKSCHN